jgi:hypothetical protein
MGLFPFIEPNFLADLNMVGLGTVTNLWALHLHLIHMAPIPRDLKLTFLPGLTLIKDYLAVYECSSDDCSIAPRQSRLVGLSAISNVYRIRDVGFKWTALTDLVSSKGLQCVHPFSTFMAMVICSPSADWMVSRPS